jgi:SAM-dependent methyltransferase
LTITGAGAQEFVMSSLPAPPARVMELGCGAGDLARSLSGAGYDVVAIDPEAPAGAIFQKVSLEDFEGGPFDAVVADRSLHHVGDLDAGVAKLRSMLAADGVVVLNEFAWDAMDEPTAAWYIAGARGGGGSGHVHGERTVADLLDGWAAEHDGLHGADALRAALDVHFETVIDVAVPYIARYHMDDVSLEPVEQRLIDEGSIRALGFRYLGRPRR